MPRVKRGTVRRAKRKKLLGCAKGYYANKSKLYRAAKESVDTALEVRVRRPPPQEARLPPAVGRPHQRRRARARPDVRPADQRLEERRRHARPQEPVGARHVEPGGVQHARQAGEGRRPKRPAKSPAKTSLRRALGCTRTRSLLPGQVGRLSARRAASTPSSRRRSLCPRRAGAARSHSSAERTASSPSWMQLIASGAARGEARTSAGSRTS